jgi:hypothetical protein
MAGPDPTPEATAEEMWGGPADPRHGLGPDPSTDYSYLQWYSGPHGPYGLDNALLGVDPSIYTEQAGEVRQDPRGDLQERTHAAPWPKGLSDSQDRGPEESAYRNRESFLIHSSDQGMSRQFDSLPPQNDEWSSVEYTDPGSDTLQSNDVPKQVGNAVSGYGSTDRRQSLAIQNRYGFDSAHVFRRFAVGSIPGNYMWMDPGSRPLRHDRLGSVPNIPTGEDSPFTGQDTTMSFGTQGAVLVDLPPEYAEPPTPVLSGADLLAMAAPSGVDFY